MKRMAAIAGLLLITCLSHLSAQIKIAVAPLYHLTKSSKLWSNDKKEVVTPVYLSSFQLTQSEQIPAATTPLKPEEYYQQHFGFFCKKEWKLEKQTQIPVKLRLGTYQEAQRIEGK